MAQMDIAAAMLVSNVLLESSTADFAVTHKYEGEFMAAAQLGDIIQLTCEIIEVRKKAIVVSVRAVRQARGSSDKDYIAWSKFVFVSKNDSGFVNHALNL